MTRTHFKEKSKRNRIDLTMIGREELIAPALAHKDEWLKAKFPEAEIVDPYTEPPQTIPTFYPDTRPKFSFLEIIKNELFNLIKI